MNEKILKEIEANYKKDLKYVKEFKNRNDCHPSRIITDSLLLHEIAIKLGILEKETV